MGGNCAAGAAAGFGQSVLSGYLEKNDIDLTKKEEQRLASMVGGISGFFFSGGEAQNVNIAAGIAQSGMANNRQMHEAEADLIRKNAKDFAEKMGISEEEAKAWLTEAALGRVEDDISPVDDNDPLTKAANEFLDYLSSSSPDSASRLAQDGQILFGVVSSEQYYNSNQNLSYWKNTRSLYQNLVTSDFYDQSHINKLLTNGAYDLFGLSNKRGGQRRLANAQYADNHQALWEDAKAALDLTSELFVNGDIDTPQMRDILLNFSNVAEANPHASDELKSTLRVYSTFIALNATSANRSQLKGMLDNVRLKTSLLTPSGNKVKDVVGTKGGVDDVKGGAHKDTSQPVGDKLDSHHCPAKDCYKDAPISSADGPAIKMDPADHKETASWGNKPGAKEYRARQQELLNQGKLEEAIQMDIDDIRRIEREIGQPGKYDQGIKEMQDYARTLDPDAFKIP